MNNTRTTDIHANAETARRWIANNIETNIADHDEHHAADDPKGMTASLDRIERLLRIADGLTIRPHILHQIDFSASVKP